VGKPLTKDDLGEMGSRSIVALQVTDISPEMKLDALQRSAADVPALLAEVARLTEALAAARPVLDFFAHEVLCWDTGTYRDGDFDRDTHTIRAKVGDLRRLLPAYGRSVGHPGLAGTRLEALRIYIRCDQCGAPAVARYQGHGWGLLALRGGRPGSHRRALRRARGFSPGGPPPWMSP
jgi:hypothetical protein